MAIKIPTPEKVDAHQSTWVALGGDTEVEKEETFPKYATSWRGDEVIVTMSCDRYRFADGRMSDWRCYASDARALKRDEDGSIAPYGYGVEMTDTARQRLSEACKPLALAWIESDEGTEAFRVATVDAIKRQLQDDVKVFGTDRTRKLIARHCKTIGDTARAQLLTACAAADAYRVAMDTI